MSVCCIPEKLEWDWVGPWDVCRSSLSPEVPPGSLSRAGVPTWPWGVGRHAVKPPQQGRETSEKQEDSVP